MNKQQLANKIWESANKMRSKIEANEYKDYILGFIFYKYLSDKEVKFLKDEGYDDELLKTVTEEDEETVEYIQKNIGYFIGYNDLFSTWLDMGKDFSVDNVTTALSAFSRLISSTHKKVFDKVFDTTFSADLTIMEEANELLVRLGLRLSAGFYSLSRIFLWTENRTMMFLALFMNI